jgi:hypothetical protein
MSGPGPSGNPNDTTLRDIKNLHFFRCFLAKELFTMREHLHSVSLERGGWRLSKDAGSRS